MTTTDPRARLGEIDLRSRLAAIKARAEEYRGSMDREVVHDWARKVVADDINMAAALVAVLKTHRPVDIEPSETICHECSTLRGSGKNARYFPFKDYPCPTVTKIQEALNGIA